jgi:hypothetical protein
VTRRASRRGCAIRSDRLALFVLALACSSARAQDADARLKALETQVEELKKRVDVLEGRGSAPASAAAPAQCPGSDRLRMSMTEAEVRGLLGPPVKVESTPLQSRWRYPCGTAYFDVQSQRFVGFE